MAASQTCPRCGAANRPGTMYCVNCGSPLSAGTPGAAAPSAPPMYPPATPPYPMAAPPMWDAERTKQVGRTKTGVLLLLIGTLISWVPIIGPLGGLLVLIGAILVILGRKAFGAAHARNVVISVVVFFVGLIVVFAGGIPLAAVIVVAAGFSAQTIPAAEVQAAFNSVLIIAVAGAIIGGLANVLFTFILQNQTGKMLLFAGYGAGVVIQVVIFVVVSADIPDILAACSGDTCNSTAARTVLDRFLGRVDSLSLLEGIPALLYAGAYYLVWNRINKGELPAPPAAPGMPPAIQPR